MRKTCLKVLFLASLMLPLAHACSDSPLVCLGTPVPCANRDLQECNAGCELRNGCYGDPITCESLTSQPTLCVQTPGCSYVGSCEEIERRFRSRSWNQLPEHGSCQ